MTKYANGTTIDAPGGLDRPGDESARYRDDPLYRSLADSLPHLVWVVDANHHFRFVNRRWIEYTGLGLEESNRLGWQSILETEDIERIERMSQMVLGSGSSGEIAVRLRIGSETPRWFMIRAVPLAPDADGVGCWLGTATDIHDQRQEEEIRLFVADLDSRMRAAGTPEDVLAEVVGTLGAWLGAARCTFLQIDLDADITSRFKVYRHVEGEELPASFDRSVLPQEFQTTLLDGGTVIVEDIYTDPRISDGELVRSVIDARSFIAVPILRQSVYVGTLSVVEVDHARTWLPEEVTLVQTVAERTWLAMESTDHFRKSEEAERTRRAFAREVLFVATHERLRMCDTADDLPAPLAHCGHEIDLRQTGGLAAVRHAASDVAIGLGFEDSCRGDLILAVGEAAINVVVHGGGGTARVCDDRRETIQVWFVDQGTGIHFDHLPRATMSRGFSTASSLGHGFKMILETADRVYLMTDETGTTVVIEHDRAPAAET